MAGYLACVWCVYVVSVCVCGGGGGGGGGMSDMFVCCVYVVLILYGQTLFHMEGRGLGHSHRAVCHPALWGAYQSQRGIQSHDT